MPPCIRSLNRFGVDPQLVLWLDYHIPDPTKWFDRSGYGNHGTVTNATRIKLRDGAYAYEFPGSGCYVEIPDNPSLDITDAITVMAWVYLRDITLDYRTVIGKSPTSVLGNETFSFDMRNDKNGAFRYSINVNGWKSIGADLPLNEWHFVAMVYDGSEFIAYMDVTIVGSMSLSGQIYVNDAPLQVGAAGGEDFWDGYIADPRVYHGALSEFEIYCIYKNTKAFFGF